MLLEEGLVEIIFSNSGLSPAELRLVLQAFVTLAFAGLSLGLLIALAISVVFVLADIYAELDAPVLSDYSTSDQGEQHNAALACN
jgi:hypothetical protein